MRLLQMNRFTDSCIQSTQTPSTAKASLGCTEYVNLHLQNWYLLIAVNNASLNISAGHPL